MNNLTLKQLRYFESLARHGHFGHAASACSITQPALSVQIRELEESLGLALFERTTRRVRLTGFGEEFASRVRTILRGVDELSDLARASQNTIVGRLRLGVIPTIAPYLLPNVVANLGRDHTGLDVRVRESLTQTLISELADSRLDAAIVALPINESWLNEIPLFTEEFVLVRPIADAGKPSPNQDDLREMKLLLLEEGHCFRDQALAYCNLQAASPRELLDASSLSTLVQLVGSGIGNTLIPEMAIPVETRSATVQVQRFAAPRPTRTIGMIWRKTNPLARQLTQIAETVRKSAQPTRKSPTGSETPR